MGEPLPYSTAPDAPAADHAPAPTPLLVDARQAAALCGISPASWHRLRAAGKIGPAPVKLGGRVLWRRSELVAWTEAGCPDRRTWEALRSAHHNGRK